uniref:RRM domain-containing protein n=1 Tax=Acrobeloides nanus TaxID=290746 RepID=A0A914DHW1_9BILA
MAAKNASNKKQGNAAVSGKTGKTAKLEETIAKGLAKGKGPENKPKLAFPTDSDEDEEMESEDEVEDEDELEDEDEEMSEFSDEDEEESEDEQPKLNLVSKGAANQKSVTSGKSGKLASSSIVEKPVPGKKAKQPVVQPSDSEEEDDEDEDEDEEESEDEQPPTKLPIKGVAKQNVAVSGKSGAVQGKTKQQVAPTSESDDEDEEDEEEDEDEEEESDDEALQTKVTSKAVANQKTAVNGKPGKPAAGVLEKSAQGKIKQQIAPALDSEEDDEDEEEEASDEEDEEDEESEGEVEEPVAKKPKVAQTVKKPVAVVSPLEQSSIMKEEERRRQERNSRSLFIKGLPPKLTDSDLKALHSDIASVRRRKTVGWIIFNTKEAADKAKQKLSQLVLPGESKPLFVDYCDERSNKKPETEKPSKAQTPINPLELVVINLPKDIKREQIQLVFKNAVNIAMNKSLHNNIFKAFVRFDNEKDARDAFEKSKNLKIGGEPVDVFFTRIQTQGAKNQNLPKSQHGAAQKTQSKVGGNVEGKSPTTDEKKTAQPQKKSFDKSAAFKQGAPSGKSFPAKAKSFDSASKGTKRPFNQGSNKQKKPRL